MKPFPPSLLRICSAIRTDAPMIPGTGAVGEAPALPAIKAAAAIKHSTAMEASRTLEPLTAAVEATGGVGIVDTLLEGLVTDRVAQREVIRLHVDPNGAGLLPTVRPAQDRIPIGLQQFVAAQVAERDGMPAFTPAGPPASPTAIPISGHFPSLRFSKSSG